MKINYKKLPPQFGDGLRASYKGVVATIFEYSDHALIYTITSKNPGKGEVREFIKLLKEDYPQVKSSAPLNQIWNKICKNYQLEINSEL